LINKHKIQSQQYFPIFGFSIICSEIDKVVSLKEQQKNKVESAIKAIPETNKTNHTSINDINDDTVISTTSKVNAILWAIHNDQLNIDDIEQYLRDYPVKNETNYRKLLCAFDLKKYNDAS